MKRVITWGTITACGVCLAVIPVAARGPAGLVADGRTAVGKLAAAAAPGTHSLININRVAQWFRRDGWSSGNPFSEGSGVTYPRGTAAAIYRDGLVWGGRVLDGQSPEIRVGGSTFFSGLTPGAIIAPGVAQDPAASAVRIYRVRRDFQTADLRRDAAELLVKPEAEVSAAEIGAVRAQYAADWAEWPWQLGAPYYDRDGNGAYNPAVDEPGLEGADQVAWFAANDLDAEATRGLYGSEPIGLEMQTTLWAYDREDALGDAVFRRYRLVYKGTENTPAGATIEDLYVSLWSDPDVGDFEDDFVGCVPWLGLGYGYNAGSHDRAYAQFGLAPPAIGYTLLQPGLSSFVSFAAGSMINEPEQSSYDGTLQWYNLMRGYQPLTDVNSPVPYLNPITGEPTNYVLDGTPTIKDYQITPLPLGEVMAGCGGDTLCLRLATPQVVVTDPSRILPVQYTINFAAGAGGARVWSLNRGSQTVLSGQPAQPGTYSVESDGIEVKVPSYRGLKSWSVPTGGRWWTWVGAEWWGAEGFGPEFGVPGAITGDPDRYWFTSTTVPTNRMRRVELRFTSVVTAEGEDQYRPIDLENPNVSYAYRYLRNAAMPAPAPGEETVTQEPYDWGGYIINPVEGYAFQDRVPICVSAWDMESDPPRRLEVGFLENNVPGGLVNGAYGPAAASQASNVAGGGPREFLFVFDQAYTSDPAGGSILLRTADISSQPLPIMWIVFAGRDGERFPQDGDTFLLVPFPHEIYGADDQFAFSVPPLQPPVGWVDGNPLPAGDRRMVLSSGLLRLELGQSHEVVLAMVGGMGVDNIQSVNRLRANTEAVRASYYQSATPPSVQTNLPLATGAADVPVVVGFDRPMDPGTLTGSALRVTGSVSGAIAGALQYEASSRSVVFSHPVPFATGEEITVVLSAAARSDRGLGLDGNWNGVSEGSPADDLTWAFTVTPRLQMTAYPAVTAPILNGVIAAGEYDRAVPVYVELTRPRTPPGVVPEGIPVPTDAADLSYTVYTLHTATDLFVAVDVADEIICDDSEISWADDDVEVVVDGDLTPNDMGVGWEYAGPEGFQVWMDAGGSAESSTSMAFGQTWFAAAGDRPAGRVVEFRIPLASIDRQDGPGALAARAGDQLGFNLMIGDDDNGGGAYEWPDDGYGAWSGNADQWLWARESDWGRLYLSPGPAPMLSLISPNGSEAWVGGSVHTVRWAGSRVFPAVKLQYSLDNGGNWTTITASAPNTGTYAWTVPGGVTGPALLRVADAADGDPADTSDLSFLIRPPRPPVIELGWAYRRAAFPGEPVAFYGKVRSNEGPVGQVTASVRAEGSGEVLRTVTLTDDGLFPDQIAGDFTFSGSTSLSQLGRFTVDLRAQNASPAVATLADAAGFQVAHTIVRFPERVVVRSDALRAARVPLFIEDDGSGYLSRGFYSAEVEATLWNNGLVPLSGTFTLGSSGIEAQGGLTDVGSDSWGGYNRWLKLSLANTQPVSFLPQSGPGQAVLGYADLTLGVDRFDHLGLSLDRVDFDEEDESGLALLGGRLEVSRGDVDLSRQINGLDAALVLKQTVGLVDLYWPDNPTNDPLYADYGIRLLPSADVAADVSGFRGITAYDAALTLQRAVGLISHFPAEEGAYRLWEAPTGWWDPPVTGPASRMVAADAPRVRRSLFLGQPRETVDGGLQVPVCIDEMDGVLAGTFSLSLTNPGLEVAQVQVTELTAGYLLAQRSQPGTLRVSFAGAEARPGSGPIAEVVLRRSATAGEAVAEVSLAAAELNEGIEVELNAAPVRWGTALPARFALHPSYPNPFNPETVIRFDLPAPALVRLAVYDLLGQRVRILVDGPQTPGSHQVSWNGRDEVDAPVGTGVYLYRLEAGDQVATGKMLLVR